jgi:hypothetical protein
MTQLARDDVEVEVLFDHRGGEVEIDGVIERAERRDEEVADVVRARRGAGQFADQR